MNTFIGLMSLKSNILAYQTVFKTAAFVMMIGALTALLIRNTKKETVSTSAEPIEL
jgi:hypothetical protein